MCPESNVLDDDVGQVIASALQSGSGTAYVVDPTASMVRSLVEAGVGTDRSASVGVLADRSVLKRMAEEFPVATAAAELVEGGAIELRVAEATAGNALVVTEGSVVAVVDIEERVAGLVTDDEAFVAEANGTYRERFEAAEPFTLRTPALSAVRTSLETELGEEVRSDFDAVFESLEAREGPDLDEVVVSLLVAARNDVLLYDVSKWGEDAGIASKATFSRTKTELEERGVIETEKVPIDVGRPRLRLRLGDERLREASPEDLAAVAAELLA
ncbi:transcriptional regulator TbsP [Halobellus ruber]|uniref:Transcriptional regulator n=1 Tax=Halobellus ruber TaxID=2761102 RepID=A0A7J9SDW8_9EURY|nr:DUF5821 family protein [Halobellus ruber]MBB6645115.1 hypothetical protein [Halobellus ruber]